MRVSGYNHKVAPFFPHQYKLRKAIEAFSGTKTNSYVAGPSVAVANDKFHGAINLPDGRVLFIPYSRPNIGLYDPRDGSFTDGPAVLPSGSARYRGGCLHAETGMVVMAPLLSPNIGLFNTRTGEFELGPDMGSSPGYHGAIVSSVTGKVILVPGTSPYVGIFDVVTRQFTQGPAHGGAATTYFSGAEELPDGRILLIPYSAQAFVIYDPVKNTCTKGPTGITSAAYFGSTKLINGDVVCAPYSAPNVAIYRWRSGTLYTVPAPTTGAKFRNAALAPDGRVIFGPNTYDRIGWYDPSNDAYGETEPLGLGSAVKFAGITQAFNGEMILAPYVNETVGRFKAVSAGALPAAAMASAQWNKN